MLLLFSPGDKVLIVQMKGAVIDSSNTSSFGTILNWGTAENMNSMNWLMWEMIICNWHISLRTRMISASGAGCQGSCV